jgi:hypothetical protein
MKNVARPTLEVVGGLGGDDLLCSLLLRSACIPNGRLVEGTLGLTRCERLGCGDRIVFLDRGRG